MGTGLSTPGRTSTGARGRFGCFDRWRTPRSARLATWLGVGVALGVGVGVGVGAGFGFGFGIGIGIGMGLAEACGRLDGAAIAHVSRCGRDLSR